MEERNFAMEERIRIWKKKSPQNGLYGRKYGRKSDSCFIENA
jgi:hypothetical protein